MNMYFLKFKIKRDGVNSIKLGLNSSFHSDFIIKQKKNLFSLNKNVNFKIFKNSKQKGELIIHPEYRDKMPIDHRINSEGKIKVKIFPDKNLDVDSDSELESDKDLSFISLDKNGVPIIKKNYYECLGLKQTANVKEVRQTFLKIARKYHPDKHPESLAFFTHVCNAYETLNDEHKRAAYDDDLLNNSEGLFYIKIWKFRINVIFLFIFSILFFLSKYAYDYYHKTLKLNYICPLGQDKFDVDKLKYTEKNESLLNFIEKTKEEIIKENTKKIAEDDEYEYYVEK